MKRIEVKKEIVFNFSQDSLSVFAPVDDFIKKIYITEPMLVSFEDVDRETEAILKEFEIEEIKSIDFFEFRLTKKFLKERFDYLMTIEDALKSKDIISIEIDGDTFFTITKEDKETQHLFKLKHDDDFILQIGIKERLN